MAQIKNEKQYQVIMQRIEDLLLITNDNTPVDSKEIVELAMLSDLAEEYELEHYPIGTPSLPESSTANVRNEPHAGKVRRNARIEPIAHKRLPHWKN